MVIPSPIFTNRQSALSETGVGNHNYLWVDKEGKIDMIIVMSHDESPHIVSGNPDHSYDIDISISKLLQINPCPPLQRRGVLSRNFITDA